MSGISQTARFSMLVLCAAACGGGSGSAMDAAPSDAAVDGPVPDGPPPVPGTVCEWPLEVPAEGTYQGDTRGSGGERGATCSGGAGRAPDVFYLVDVGEISVDLVIDGHVDESAADPFDLVLSARTDCTQIDTELGCRDTGLGEHVELLEVTGPLTILVDGTDQYGNRPSGPYTLETRLREILAPDSPCDPHTDQARCAAGYRCVAAVCSEDSPALACAEAIDITADLMAGGFDITATTRPYAADHYQGACAFDPTAGSAEHIYRVELSAPGVLTATTDLAETRTDTVLYLRSEACDGDELACADDVDPKADNFTSTLITPMLAPGIYYLVIDGSVEPSTGTYHLNVTLGS